MHGFENSALLLRTFEKRSTLSRPKRTEILTEGAYRVFLGL